MNLLSFQMKKSRNNCNFVFYDFLLKVLAKGGKPLSLTSARNPDPFLPFLSLMDGMNDIPFIAATSPKNQTVSKTDGMESERN